MPRKSNASADATPAASTGVELDRKRAPTQTRALRAVPSLAPVRIESHEHVTGLLVAAFALAYPAVPQARVRLVSRLAIEVMYSAQELLVDDATLDAVEVATVMSHMVTTQVMQLRKERA